MAGSFTIYSCGHSEAGVGRYGCSPRDDSYTIDILRVGSTEGWRCRGCWRIRSDSSPSDEEVRQELHFSAAPSFASGATGASDLHRRRDAARPRRPHRPTASPSRRSTAPMTSIHDRRRTHRASRLRRSLEHYYLTAESRITSASPCPGVLCRHLPLCGSPGPVHPPCLWSRRRQRARAAPHPNRTPVASEDATLDLGGRGVGCRRRHPGRHHARERYEEGNVAAARGPSVTPGKYRAGRGQVLLRVA
jgi:hypothetical protein